MRRAAAGHLRAGHLALNLSRVFSLRSRESGMVGLSSSFAGPLSRSVPACPYLLADGRVSNLVSIRLPRRAGRRLVPRCQSASGNPGYPVLAHWPPS